MDASKLAEINAIRAELNARHAQAETPKLKAGIARRDEVAAATKVIRNDFKGGLPHALYCTFDGACGPTNVGGALGLGWVISGQPDCRYVVRRGDNTNNRAEYGALMCCLDAVLHLPNIPPTIYIAGDSQVVVKQINGQYHVRTASLHPWHDGAIALMQRLRAAGRRLVLFHIYREHNQLADEYAGRALASNGAVPRWTAQSDLLTRPRRKP